MIKTIYFDFDGVITIDSKGSGSFANYIVAETGLNRDFFLKNYRDFGSDLLTGKKSHLDIWPELCEKIGLPISERLINEAFIATPINHEVIELIDELKAKGYQIGLITDNKTDRMNTLIEFNEWQELFEVLAISANVGSRKDTPDIYRYALEANDTKANEAVFIDNTLKNLDIPAELGFKTIFFDNDLRDTTLLRANLINAGVNL